MSGTLNSKLNTRQTENIFHASPYECPAAGMYWRGSIVDDNYYFSQVMKLNNFKTSHQYREWHKENGDTLIKNTFNYAKELSTCKNVPHGEIKVSALPRSGLLNQDVKIHTTCFPYVDERNSRNCQMNPQVDSGKN